MAQAKILIVEDEKLTAESISRILQLLGHKVLGIADSGEQALELAADTPPDLALMDILLAGELDGIETATHLRENFNVPVVYLTARTDEEILARARATRPYGYIIKPVRHLTLQVTLEMALAQLEVNTQLQQQTYILNERVKELNCLFELGKLIETPDITLEDIFQGVVHLLPPAWQYPDITCARLTMDNTSFSTENFEPTLWRQTTPIRVQGKSRGHIEIGYLEERANMDEGPFMQEERHLIQTIAEQVGHVIERVQTQQALYRAYEDLEQRVQARTAELAAANYQLTHEIAERKRAEKALQEREEKVRAILNATTATVALLNRQGIILDGNLAFAERFGRPLDQLIGQCIWDLFPPDVTDAREALVHEVFQTGHPIRQEDEREGMWNDYVIYPIHDAQGRVNTVAVYAQDITRRVLMQQALREREALYSRTFDAIPDAAILWEWHSDGRVTMAQANALAIQMSQGKLRACMGNTAEEFFSHSPEVANRIRHTFETGQQQRVETHYYLRTLEEKRWLIADYVRTSDRFLLNIIRDITEQKLAEQAVQESEKQLRQILNLVPHLIFAKDHEGRFLLVNEAKAKFSGQTVAQMTGYLESEWVTDAEVLQKIQTDDQEIIEQRATKFFSEERFVDAYNQEHIMQTTKIPFDYGEQVGVLGISVDITALKTAEGALREALGEKEVLLRELHHRVKNNLQVITDLIALQSEQITDPKTLDYCRELRDRVMAMALVHEELYRMQSLARIQGDIYLSDLADNLQRSFARAPIEIYTETQNVFLSVDTAIPCGLIITELITNALKYAFPDTSGEEAHKVSVKLYAEENQYTLSVSDNGIGLPPTVNWQAPTSLGLELVQSWVEQLQGILTVNTNPGTTFTITFPVPSASL